MSGSSGTGLQVRDLEVRLRRVTILRRVTLEVPPGTLVGLVGRNGAGKTTTLRAIMGLMPATGGSIVADGHDLGGVPAFRRARLGLGYMPEDRRLIPGLTVLENLLVPVWAGSVPHAEARLRWVLEAAPELRALTARPASQLSGGQQKLVALARALMAGTRWLLLDEPFEGLAPALAERIAEVLRTVVARGGPGVLLAESARHLVGRLAQVVYTVERGETVGKDVLQ